MIHKRIVVHVETYDELSNLKHEGQSYNGIIKELMKKQVA